MARINLNGPTNNPELRWPYSDDGGEEPSAGTSSSTSESTLDRSGTSGTPDLPSPVPSAESLSETDLQAQQAPSSSASSTDGSTQETGLSQPDLPASSEESQAATPATPVLSELHPSDAERAARDLIQSAREAYEARDFDLADARLNDAEKVYPSIASETAVAHAAVAAARQAITS